MRVLYTHRTQGVGAEGAHVKGIYLAFGQLGHAIEMDCLPGCDPTQQAKAAPAPAAAAKPKPSPITRLYWLIADHAPQVAFEAIELGYNGLLFARLLLKCLRRRPALVYERYSLNTFAPTLVCKLLGIKHALEVNDSVVIERSRPLKLKGLSAAVEGYCLRGADLNITITERFRGQLRERFGADRIKVEVMTNAVERKRFEGPFDRAAARKRLGLGDAVVIGGAGQFLDWHGLEDLVAQMGPLAEEKDIRFLFIGDGPARAAVEAKAAALGVADRVHFTGMLPIDAVGECLSALDIAVIPKAAPHASPMKLIEYMAMGLPIAAPEIPSIRAALQDGSMGRIFPAGDMGAMREAVLALMADRPAAAALGAKARAHVFAHLTWDRHAQQVIGILGLK